MNKKEDIEILYFKEKMNLTEISKSLNISIGYISQILKNNDKYFEEKERRKKDNLLERRKKQKEKIYSYRRNQKIDFEYINVQNSHKQASKEMSKSHRLGNQTLRKWCGSAYRYNKLKKRYEFDVGNLTKSNDLPQYIKIWEV